MSYEFKTLGSVEALTEVPENANALVEVDGAIKRVPGGALGGNNNSSAPQTFILNQSIDEDDYFFNSGDSLKMIQALTSGNVIMIYLKYFNEDSGIFGVAPALMVTLSYESANFLDVIFSDKTLRFMLQNDEFIYQTPAEPT